MSNHVDLIYKQVSSFEQEFTSICSEPSIAFKRESEFAMQVFSNNDYLAKVALSNPVSTRSAVMNIAAIGITLNPAQKLAYLVPRKGNICLDISYMGLMHIAQQSGAIKWCQSAIVRSNDKFHRVGIDKPPVHEFNEFDTTEKRGEMVGVYCVVKTDGDDYLTHTMRISDVFAIRDRSEGYKSGKQSPWKSDEEQMILKTVVKQAAKYWPRRERLDNAISYVNTDGGEGINFNAERSQLKDVTPTTDEHTEAITNLLIKLDKTWDSDLLPLCTHIFNRTITSASELTQEEAVKVIDFLSKKAAA